MKLAVCIWALGEATQVTLQDVAQLGFKWIDVQPHMLSGEAERGFCSASGLRVSCIGVLLGYLIVCRSMLKMVMPEEQQ